MNSKDSLRIIEVIEKSGVKPTEYEKKFVPSVKEQLQKGYALNTKQMNVLMGIYQRITEKNPNAW